MQTEWIIVVDFVLPLRRVSAITDFLSCAHVARVQANEFGEHDEVSNVIVEKSLPEHTTKDTHCRHHLIVSAAAKPILFQDFFVPFVRTGLNFNHDFLTLANKGGGLASLTEGSQTRDFFFLVLLIIRC